MLLCSAALKLALLLEVAEREIFGIRNRFPRAEKRNRMSSESVPCRLSDPDSNLKNLNFRDFGPSCFRSCPAQFRSAMGQNLVLTFLSPADSVPYRSHPNPTDNSPRSLASFVSSDFQVD